jgi:Acetyltransferase (GNAT) domain
VARIPAFAGDRGQRWQRSPGRRLIFLRREGLTPDFVTAWRDLAQRAAEPNPFAEPEIVVPALRHLSDGPRAGVLAVVHGDRVDAVLPVSWPVLVPVRGHRVPVPLVQATVQPFRPLGTPLVDADDPVSAMSVLLQPSAALPAAAVVLRYFAEGGPVAAALDEALRRRGQQALRTKTYERALLLREGGPPPNKNRKNRYNRLRRHREDLQRDLGPTSVVDRAADPEALEQFLRLEASGWKGQEGTALACNDAHAAWFREVCAELRDQGRLEVLSLEAGGRPVAMWCDFAAGDGSFHLKSAYDESLGAYRPGAQLAMHCVDARPGGPAWRDSSTVPDNTLFNQLWPSRRTLSTLVVPLHGRIGSTALALARRAQQHRSVDVEPAPGQPGAEAAA